MLECVGAFALLCELSFDSIISYVECLDVSLLKSDVDYKRNIKLIYNFPNKTCIDFCYIFESKETELSLNNLILTKRKRRS